jgi:transcriptional regulator
MRDTISVMYLPPSFEVTDRALLLELMRRHPFATVVGVVDGAPEITHLPLLVKDESRIEGHVARANPLARLVERAAPLTAVFHGPHVYVSPRFYRTEPNVPTWNYVVVHASGPTRAITERDAVATHLSQLVDAFEDGAWSYDRVREHADQILTGVVAFALTVERLEGKLKLNQNRDPEDWAGVVEHLADREPEMVALMRRLGPPRP